MSIRVVAHITARPETVDETRDLLLSLIEPTRAESGCVTYELMQNTTDPTDFTFVEEWSCNEALDEYLQTEHIQQVVSRADELLAASPDIRRYKLLG